jgi:choloylglycine hydrolase
VWGKVYEELGNIPAPLHLALHDSERSAVLEWVGGELHVHDNPLGVLTNSPPFDWHMINLRNYVNLHVTDVGEATFAGVRLPQMGQGSGLIGLPGDWTPPSRFVRAAVISHLAEVGADADAAVRTAIHVLNNFDIPVGVSRSADGIAAHDDYTQWSSIADLSRRSYFIRFAVDSGFHEIPLDSLGLESGEMRLLAARTPRDAVIPVLEM